MESRRVRRRAVVIVGAAACVGLIVLGVVLLSRGLDVADKVASVISMFVGLAGLVVAVLALRASGGGPAVSVDARLGDIEAPATALEVGDVKDGALSTKLEAGDVRSEFTGIRLGDIGGTDDRDR